MKSSKLIMGCLATLGLAAGAAAVQAEVDRDAIAERLKPVGELCLQGEDCGTAATQDDSADNGASDGGGIDGESIYGNVCAACHDTGAAGAPVRGDEDAWAQRVDKGFDTLLDHSINGFNAMPARGGNPNLSDEEVQAATAYLVEPVMEVPEGAGEASSDDEQAASDEEEAASDDEQAASDEEEAASDEEEAASGEDEAAASEEAASDEDEAAESGAPSHADIDGEAIYNQACMACHMTGAAGAPVRGDEAAWGERMEKGIETLYDHSINGFNAMPAKGGNPGLSDDEVKAATDYLVEPVQ